MDKSHPKLGPGNTLFGEDPSLSLEVSLIGERGEGFTIKSEPSILKLTGNTKVGERSKAKTAVKRTRNTLTGGPIPFSSVSIVR